MKELKEPNNQPLLDDEKKLQALADIASRQSQTRRNRGARNIIAGAVAFFILAGLVLGLMLILPQNKISVSFYQGSELIQTIKVSKDSRISKESIPAVPEKDGKVFTGNWFTNPNATGDPFDFETKITTTKKLYAEMESKKITVEIQKNDSSGGSITLLQDSSGHIIFPTYEDFITTVSEEYSLFYELLGFDSNANSTNPKYLPGAIVTESPETLHAIWVANVYNALINGNGGNFIYNDLPYYGETFKLSYGDEFLLEKNKFSDIYQQGTGARVGGLKITLGENEEFFELGSTIIIDQRFTNDTIEFELAFMEEKNILTIDFNNPDIDTENILYFGYRGYEFLESLPYHDDTKYHYLEKYQSSEKDEKGNYLYFYPGDPVPVMGEVTYTAVWSGVAWRVLINTNNGGSSSPFPIQFYQKYGEGFFVDSDCTEVLETLPILTRVGHTFVGYSYNIDGNTYQIADKYGQFMGELLNEINTFKLFTYEDMIHAEYQINTYELELIDNEYGTITAEEPFEIQGDKYLVEYNENFNFKIKLNEEYSDQYDNLLSLLQLQHTNITKITSGNVDENTVFQLSKITNDTTITVPILDANTYITTFKDYNGTVLSSTQTEHGNKPTYTQKPSRTNTHGLITFDFAGWEIDGVIILDSNDFLPATKNATYTATYIGRVVAPNNLEALIYNGYAQSPIIATSNYYTHDVTAQKDAGDNYTAILQLKEYISDTDRTPLVWEDGENTDNITLNWQINKAELVIRADNKVKVYGENHDLPEFTFTINGLQGTDTKESLKEFLNITLSTNADKYSDVRDYDIIINGVSETTNYSITYKNGTLTITENELLGIDLHDDFKSFTYTGEDIDITAYLTNYISDIMDVVTYLKDTDTETANPKNANDYTTTIILKDDNYSWADGVDEFVFHWSITKNNLTITANNASKTYGKENPSFDYKITGLQGDDNITDLGLNLNLFTNADKDSPVTTSDTTYFIKFENDSQTTINYNITFIDATLTINARSVEMPTITGATVFVYNEITQTPIINSNDNYTITYYMVDSENNIIDNEIPTPTKAGKYVAEITLNNPTDYTNYIWTNGESDAINLYWEITQFAPTFSQTQTYNYYLGQDLDTHINDININETAHGAVGNTIPGEFSFENANEKPTLTTRTVIITFTPEDTTNYKTVTFGFEIKVEQILLSFVSNGGTSVNTLPAMYGEKLSGLQPEPTRNHYDFAGWYKDAELLELVDWADYMVTAPVTFYAKWVANTYTLTFDRNATNGLNSVQYPNDDTPVTNGPHEITYGTSFIVKLDEVPFVELYEKTTGKRVVGVRVVETNQIYNSANPNILVDRDMTLVFVFETTGNSITINYNGGSENGTTNLYEDITFYGIDSNISLYPTVKKQFYTLLGYSTKNLNYNDPSLTTITANDLQNTQVQSGETTYYAIWEPISVNFIYNVNGGTGTASGSTSTKFGNANFTLAGRGTMTQDFKTFTGWSLQPNGVVAHAPNSVLNINTALLTSNDYETSNYKIGDSQITITLYAKWIQNQTTIHLNYNGGSGSPASKMFNSGDKISVSQLDPSEKSRTGYTFIGWSETINGTVITSEYTVPITTTTLYAAWQANEYIITLNPNGGTVPDTTYKVFFDSTYTLPSPIRAGYTFTGWTTPNGDNMAITGTWKTTSNTTLTAHWQANTYTVNLELNGGEHTRPLTFTVDYDATYNLGYPTRENYYMFMGWYEDAEFNKSVNTTGTWKYTENKTFYAKWQKEKVEVTLDAGEGSLNGIESTSSIDMGGKFEMPSAFEMQKTDEPTTTAGISTSFVLAFFTANITIDGKQPGHQFEPNEILENIGENDVTFTAHYEVRYHIMEYGSYPKTYVGDSLNATLEAAYNAGTLIATGKSYTTNGDMGTFEDPYKYGDYIAKENFEYEFNNDKYVRVQVIANLPGYTYLRDEKMGDTGTWAWFKVQPIRWIITNWDNLPTNINPYGNATELQVNLFAEQIIISGVPFYPNTNDENRSMWENSTIREYLNNTLIHEAFTDIEKNRVLEQSIANTGAGVNYNTLDRIYLPYYADAFDSNIFENNKSRRTSPTDFSLANNAYLNTSYQDNIRQGTGHWWLRVAYNTNRVYRITHTGVTSDTVIDFQSFGIRPMMSISVNNILTFGEYPKNYVGDALNVELETAYNDGDLQDGMTATGKDFTSRNTTSIENLEYLYKSTKYVRIKVRAFTKGTALRPTYKNGETVSATGTIAWFKVEPIRWIILNWDKLPTHINPLGDGSSNKYELIAEENLTSGISYNGYERYSGESDNFSVIWQNSYMREYLNNTLINQAFTGVERLQILDTINSNYDIEGNDWENPKGVTGMETVDKMYLLSTFELTSNSSPYSNIYYNDLSCRAKATDFAIGNHASLYCDYTQWNSYYTRTNYTRTNTDNTKSLYNAMIDYEGYIDYSNFDMDIRGIRPAMQLNLHEPIYEFGEYPQTYVGNTLNTQLEDLYNNGDPQGGLIPTGKIYTTNGSEFDSAETATRTYTSKPNQEFIFNGEKFVRISNAIKPERMSATFKNGTSVGALGTIYWFKVQPMRWILLNWHNMPHSINPHGDQTAMQIHVIAQEGIIGGIPFYNTAKEGTPTSLWKESQTREYLNDIFFNEAFTQMEANRILETSITNTSATGAGYDSAIGGGVEYNTLDKIYLPSYYEMNNEDSPYRHVFTFDDDKKLSPTDFSLSNGAWIRNNYSTRSRVGNSYYITRSARSSAIVRDKSVSGGNNSFTMLYGDRVLRPIMQLSLHNILEFGNYPKTYVGDTMNSQLETAYNNGNLQNGMVATGKDFTSHNTTSIENLEYL